MKLSCLWLFPFMLLADLLVPCNRALSQVIVPSPQDTGTIVNVGADRPNQVNITGGTQAGANLFHSFQQFGVEAGKTANFQSNPAIQNILSRVVGGDASVINGQLRVQGSNANLFLMNPAGIVFGPNAQLNLPAAFTATTANAIGFESGWFSAIGQNNFAKLLGNPSQFAFTTPQPGSIINNANLTVKSGLTLLGGNVVSSGAIVSPEGNVSIQAVPGEQLVQVTAPGQLLSLMLPAQARSQINNTTFNPVSLAALITGGNVAEATVTTVQDGVVRLTGASINAKNIEIKAPNIVQIHDTVTQPVKIQAIGDLTIRGDRGIDILALNHPGAALQSQGNLNLISDGAISGDAHFASGGTVAMRTTTGGFGKFVSLYDPVISADGDVLFGDYTGASLKVEAKGSITAGNITITGPDTTLRVFPDWDTTGQYEIIDRRTAASPTISPSAIRLQTYNSNNASLKTRVPFSAQVGQTISFDWEFSTEENAPVNAEKDIATVTLTRQGGITQVFQLASYDDTLAGQFPRSTGLKTFSTNIPIAGDYTLDIAVKEQGINAGDSELLIKNINPLPVQISDNSLLAAHPALILKAGLGSLENPPNLPQLNVPTIPTNFTGSGTTASNPGASNAGIVVGNIDVLVGGIGNPFNNGSIILTAPGKISAGVGGTLRGGSVDIQAGGEIRAGRIGVTRASSKYPYQSDGSVTLKNTSGKIIVDYIRNKEGDNITIDAYDGFQATDTTPVRSVTNSALASSPASIVTTGKISIQHGGQPIQVGLGVERDATGAIVYRAVGGPRDGERVLIKISAVNDQIGFVYSDNTPVTVPAAIRSVPFDPATVPADTNYTAGGIFRGEGFNETLYGAFQDQQLGGNNITVAAIPRPPRAEPTTVANNNPGTTTADSPTTIATATSTTTTANVTSQTPNLLNKPQCPTETIAPGVTTIASRSPRTATPSTGPCAPARRSATPETILKIDPAVR
jgi:filamentous hemagglutinin family protein